MFSYLSIIKDQHYTKLQFPANILGYSRGSEYGILIFKLILF